jgi:hypothetical protein
MEHSVHSPYSSQRQMRMCLENRKALHVYNPLLPLFSKLCVSCRDPGIGRRES